MPNSSNNNSYLILYLVIILVLLYAITFMSSYTCNVSVQPTETFKQKENFSNYYEDDDYDEENEENEEYDNSEYYPNGIPAYPYEDFGNSDQYRENFESQPTSDLTILAIGSQNNIYKQIIKNNAGTLSTSQPFTSNGRLYDICVLNDGSLVGIGLNNIFFTNATSDVSAPWVSVNPALGKTYNYITQKRDGTFLATGTDNNLYSLATLQSQPVSVVPYKIGKVVELQNGDILYIGGDNLNSLCKMNSNFDMSSFMTIDATAGITYVQQAVDSSIVVIMKGGTIGRKNLADISNNYMMWTDTGVCCFSAFAILQSYGPGTMAAPPLTSNDFTLVAAGNGYQVFVQDIIGGAWNENSTEIQGSQSVIDIAVTPSGGLLGIGAGSGTENFLYMKQTLTSPWVKTQLVGSWNAVSVANDGHTLILVGQDTNIYMADLNILTNPAILVDNGHYVLKMIQLQNGQFLAVGTDTNLYIGNGTFVPYNISWSQVSTNQCCAKSIAQAPNGSILILDTNGNVQTAPSVGAPWTITKACCFLSIAAMPMPPQTIKGYNRKGAFIDDNSRTMPNFIGNYNTLPGCISAAQGKGYNTVGYQYMTQCFAGNDSPYDRNGFQTNKSLSTSAYPGAWTNIVYKTNSELTQLSEPAEGEAYVYGACQFGGNGIKMSVGQYATLEGATEIRSIKLGKNTKVILYPQANFQGTSAVFYGYSDFINKDNSCFDFTFSSVKIEKYPDAMPKNSVNLTNAQLVNLWKQAGCNAESSLINDPKAVVAWKGGKYTTTAEVISDMKQWATLDDPLHKRGCYTAAPQPDVPSEGEVVLFEACDFGGKYKKYGMGNVSYVGNDFNDITSSIKIGPYTSVTIYENSNYGGRQASWKNDSASVSTISCLIANNFNDMLSSLKVTSSTAQVNFNLNLQASPVTVLGPWNTAPWKISTFADQSAQWIWWNKWNGAFPNGSAPIDPKPVRFQLLVPISGNRDIPVIVHVIADNAPQGANFVKVNGKLVGQIIDSGWATPNYTQIQTSLAPGNNLIEFDVQNTGGGAGLLASVINTNTFEVVANSGTGQWAWVDPSIIVSAIMTEEVGSEFTIHDEAAKGKNVTFKNLNEMPPMMVGGTFRLSVNLTSVPPYIKGQQYKTGDTNQFYLSIEKIDPNCQVQDGGKCMNVYVDNKKCANATLSNVSRANAYRIVLVSKAYVLDPDIPFGKNVDFTLVKVGEKLYLKNIQTGYMPKLFVNDYKQQLYGYMDTSYLSNINSLKSNQNKLCGVNATVETPSEEGSAGGVGNILGKAMGGLFGKSEQAGPATNQKFVNCSTNADGSMYMMTTTNLVESNPIKFILNKDGSVSIRLQQFNSYGNIDKTFSLVFCNFNVNTYAFIEKLTNPLGTFLINMVCFDPDDKRQLPNNTLNFSVEISKYPDSYLKEKNIYNLNS